MAEAGSGRVVLCRVGSERFALPVAAVREVVACPPVARIPGAPDGVRGIANVHGTLVTTVSAPQLFGLPSGGESGWLVVLTLQDGRVGIEVDEVEDVEPAGAVVSRTVDLDLLLRPLFSQAT